MPAAGEPICRMVHTLETDTWLARPMDEAFAFFGDAHNLQRITPPFLNFRTPTPAPITMGVGTLIDYRIKLRSVPITWRTRISAWEPSRRFIDEPLKGLYRTWIDLTANTLVAMSRHHAIHELPEEGATAALARSIAAMLAPGDVVTLEGQLGAGKTTFVRHLADALGVAHGSVSSPTFVVINQYAIPPRDRTNGANAAKPAYPLAPSPGGGQLIHVDAYRVHDPAELENAGWDHLFDRKGHPIGAAAAIIEWPSRILAAIPEDACRIVLETIGVDSRRVEISIPSAWLDDAGLARVGAQASRDAARRVMESPPIRCPVTREWVEPTRASYPFASDRARLADLHKWFSGEHAIPREIRPEDDEDMGLG